MKSRGREASVQLIDRKEDFAAGKTTRQTRERTRTWLIISERDLFSRSQEATKGELKETYDEKKVTYGIT